MITEVDSTNRYRVISWEGVNYHKTPTEYDWVYEGSGKDLKKDATICATPVAHWNCTKCDKIVTQPDADQCSNPKCGNKGEGWKTGIKDWVVTKNGFLPIRVPMWSNSHIAFAGGDRAHDGAMKILEEFCGLTVTGAGLKSADEPSLCPDGCYVKREADHYPQPKPYKKCSRASEWNRAHHGQWYERHDGAFIYFGWHTNDWRWCIFSKNGVCQYFSDPANYEDGPPADGWTLTHRGHRCQGCRGNRHVKDKTVAEEACSTKEINHNCTHEADEHTKECPECHATGSVEYAAPTVVVS